MISWNEWLEKGIMTNIGYHLKWQQQQNNKKNTKKTLAPFSQILLFGWNENRSMKSKYLMENITVVIEDAIRTRIIQKLNQSMGSLQLLNK